MLTGVRFTVARLCCAVASLMAGCSGGTSFDHALRVAQDGHYREAIQLFTRLAQRSNDPAIYGNRGNCYSYLGEFDAALADYQTAINLIKARSPNGTDPLLPYMYYNRGTLYGRAKKYSLAVADYETTIALQANYPEVKHKLAWLLATCADASVRNPQRAMELARQEFARSPDNAGLQDTIAACYAAAGDFDRAVPAQERAISLCRDRDYLQGFRDRLEQYRNQQPYVDDD